MRYANLLNDYAFKYVFGQDCKEANDALKALLTVFLDKKVEKVLDWIFWLNLMIKTR